MNGAFLARLLHGIVCVFATTVLLLRTAAVRADEIPVVTLGPAGPDKAFPVGDTFYIGGSAEEHSVTAYAVFVRVSWPFLGLGGTSPGECSELSRSWGLPKKLGEVSGIRDSDEVWGGTADHSETTLVTDAAKIGADRQFKILVPSSSFFRQGASYCLFVYFKARVTKQSEVDFRTPLLKQAKACNQRFCDDAEVCPPEERKEEYLACRQQDVEATFKHLELAFEGVPAEKAEAAWSAIRGKLFDAAAKLDFSPIAVRNVVGSWSLGYHGPDGDLYSVEAPLGRVLSQLLAQNGKINRYVLQSGTNGDPSTRVLYFDAEGKEVSKVGVTADFRSYLIGLKLPDDPNADPPRIGAVRVVSTGVDPETTLFPDSALSLTEAWRFAQGRVKIGGEYHEVRKLWASRLASLLPRGRAPSADALAALKEVRDAFGEVSSLIEHAEDPRFATDSTNSGEVLKYVRSYARLTSARADTERLVHYLDDYLEAARNWNDPERVIREVIEEKLVVARVVDVKSARLTQKRWFDTYFSPMVGRARVLSPRAKFTETYFGIQIFPYANSIDEPMWINGAADFRRFASLELAVIPKTSIGPSDRFSGAFGEGSLPLLFGLALQPLPYVTASGGGIWLSERKSRLEGEALQAKVFWYVGLSVQANVPGLIRTIATKASAEAGVEGGKP